MKDLLPILVALVALIGTAFAVAAGVVMLSSGSCSPSARQPGTLLIYEVVPQSTSDTGPVDIRALVAAIDRRVNPRGYAAARVRQLDDRRVEVGVFGRDTRMVERIERLLERPGTLELRILASTNDQEPLIKLARSEEGRVLKDANGKVQAWWVPVREGVTLGEEPYFGYVDEEQDFAERTRKQGRREVREVLVVNDSFDVTGAYLERASPEKDRFGRPCAGFELDPDGARLLGSLTGDNLPDQLQGFSRRLGIIVDGEVYSAPAIVRPIFERGQVTGNFTRVELQQLVDVLNSGPLPARVKQVEKRTVDSQQ